jgi:hypothetical protein
MAYIGTSPSNGVRRRFVYEATASQTSFSGSDENGVTLTYVDSLYLDVFQNGIKLKAGDDYTATTGTSVVLVQGASANDVVEMVAFDVFSVGDTVSAKDGGSFAGNVAMAGTLGVTGVLTGTSLDISGDIDVDGVTNLDVVDIDGAVDMATTLAVTGIATFTDDIIIGDGKTIGSASDVDAITIHSNGVVSASAGVALGVGTANTASNVLDDYEEGTWTPVDNNGNEYSSSVIATYTKIGRQVYINFDISSTGSTGGNGIHGLPFTASAASISGNWSVYGGYSTSNADLWGHVNASDSLIAMFVGSSTHVLSGRWMGAGIYYTG